MIFAFCYVLIASWKPLRLKSFMQILCVNCLLCLLFFVICTQWFVNQCLQFFVCNLMFMRYSSWSNVHIKLLFSDDVYPSIWSSLKIQFFILLCSSSYRMYICSFDVIWFLSDLLMFISSCSLDVFCPTKVHFFHM